MKIFISEIVIMVILFFLIFKILSTPEIFNSFYAILMLGLSLALLVLNAFLLVPTDKHVWRKLNAQR